MIARERGVEGRLPKLDTPLAACAIAALGYLLFIALRLSPFGFDPSIFVAAGDRIVDPRYAPPTLFVLPDSMGYDGEIYYRLALNPWTDQPSEFGITLHNPLYYQQRILYPLLAWAVSLGRPALVPAALIAVNYAALCGLGWLAGRYAQRLGRHALWGLALVLAPPFVFSLARDLTEITEAVFLVGGLLAVRSGRDAAAGLLLALAALARPSALLVAGGLALAQLRAGTWRPRPALSWLVPLLAVGAWRLWLHAHWNGAPFGVVQDAFALPGTGLLAAWWTAASMRDHFQTVQFIEHWALVAFAVSVGWACHAHRGPAHERLAWYLALLLVVSLGEAVWISDWGFMRALVEFHLLGVIILLSVRTRLADLTLCAGVAGWGATALEVLWRLI